MSFATLETGLYSTNFKLFNLYSILYITENLQGYPRITQNPSLKNVEKEQTATLVCSARAENMDQPTIYWLKDNLPLETGDPRIKVDKDGRIKHLIIIISLVNLWKQIYCVSEVLCFCVFFLFFSILQNVIEIIGFKSSKFVLCKVKANQCYFDSREGTLVQTLYNWLRVVSPMLCKAITPFVYRAVFFFFARKKMKHSVREIYLCVTCLC